MTKLKFMHGLSVHHFRYTRAKARERLIGVAGGVWTEAVLDNSARWVVLMVLSTPSRADVLPGFGLVEQGELKGW